MAHLTLFRICLEASGLKMEGSPIVEGSELDSSSLVVSAYPIFLHCHDFPLLNIRL